MAQIGICVQEHSMTETAAPLASIDALKSYLVDVVNAAAHSDRGPKVLLSYVGGEFNKLVGTPFEKHVTDLAEKKLIDLSPSKRKMISFIEAYCADLIEFERMPGNHYIVFPRAGAQKPASDGDAASDGLTKAPSVLKFKRAVWAAFIRPLGEGRRFLNLGQIGFTDAATMPGEGQWKEIDRAFILGLQHDDPVDAGKVQASIEAWAAQAQVPISKLVIASASPSAEGRHLKALYEIIEALPAPLAEQWPIPAAVIKYLRRAR